MPLDHTVKTADHQAVNSEAVSSPATCETDFQLEFQNGNAHCYSSLYHHTPFQPSIASQGFYRVQLCRIAGGKEAENNTDQGGAGEGHNNGARREDHLEVGAQQIEKSADPEGEHDPHEAADKADHDSLDQELGEDVAAARADGHTNADLLGAFGHGYQHDIHHANAADDQRDHGD